MRNRIITNFEGYGGNVASPGPRASREETEETDLRLRAMQHWLAKLVVILKDQEDYSAVPYSKMFRILSS